MVAALSLYRRGLPRLPSPFRFITLPPTPYPAIACIPNQESPLDLAGQGEGSSEEEAKVVRLLLSKQSAHSGGAAGAAAAAAKVALEFEQQQR